MEKLTKYKFNKLVYLENEVNVADIHMIQSVDQVWRV